MNFRRLLAYFRRFWFPEQDNHVRGYLTATGADHGKGQVFDLLFEEEGDRWLVCHIGTTNNVHFEKLVISLLSADLVDHPFRIRRNDAVVLSGKLERDTTPGIFATVPLDIDLEPDQILQIEVDKHRRDD